MIRIIARPKTPIDYSAVETMSTMRYLPISQIGDAVALVDAVNKKAARLKVDGIELLAIGDPVTRHRKNIREHDHRSGAVYRGHRYSSRPIEGETRPVEMVKIAIVGRQPRIEGFTMLAAVDHLPEGDDGAASFVVRRATEAPDDLISHVRSAPSCDHCGSERQRSVVYLLRSCADGSIIQVGGSCLHHYTGGKDIEKLLALWADVGGSWDRLSDSEELGGRCRPYLPLRSFLARVAQIIRMNGWCSRKMASDRATTSTADRAIAAATWTKSSSTPQPEPTTLADIMTAYRSIIWARRQPPSNDFLHTIRALASQGLIEFKHSGFAAAIVSAYLRDKDRLKVERGLFSGWNREARISGAGRRVFRVRLVAMPRACESAYGVTYLIKFLDLDTGALLTTFASEGIAEARPDSIALGSEFEIKATLGNKTRSFNGAAETSISRVAWPSPALAT